MERVRDGGDHLQMPATGPVVLEAHLVTQEDPQPYPSTSTETFMVLGSDHPTSFRSSMNTGMSACSGPATPVPLGEQR
jgi:hypothetical protein